MKWCFLQPRALLFLVSSPLLQPRDENLLRANDNNITEVTGETPTPNKEQEEEDEKMETAQDSTADTSPKEEKEEKMEEEGVKTT